MARPMSEAALARHRAQAEANMVDTCALVGTITTDTEAGGFTEEESTLASGPCVVYNPSSPDERQVAASLEETEVLIVGVPVEGAVATALGNQESGSRRLVINGTRTLHVRGVMGPITNETMRRIVAVERGD